MYDQGVGISPPFPTGAVKNLNYKKTIFIRKCDLIPINLHIQIYLMRRPLLSFLGIAVTIILTICTNAFAGPGVDKNAMKPAGLSFIENKGQVRDQNREPRTDIQFSLKAAGGLTIFIGDGAIHYQFSKPDKEVAKTSKQDMMNPDRKPEQVTYTMDRMDVELVGANKHAQVITEQKQEYYENYFTDWSGEKGATAHGFGKITYKDIYPNIDWVLYVNNGQLKHEFVVRQGGKVSDIQLKYGGAKELKLNADGSLTANTPQGTITEQAPNTYQKDGKKVTSSFRLSNNVLSYTTGSYHGELIIDPTLIWATYFGGSGADYGKSVKTDASGNIYLVGNTNSTSAIATSGAYHTTLAGSNDVFLAKFTNAGAIVYATYYGGSGDDQGNSVAIDPAGYVYVAGTTTSTSGIAFATGYQPTFGGGSQDGFLVKFNFAGTPIDGTYYGGSDYDQGQVVTVDGSGNVFLSGTTLSTTGISTPGAYQVAISSTDYDTYLVKFNSSGVRQWGTYFGGNGGDYSYSLAADGSGNIYLCGVTYSTVGVATPGAHQTVFGGSWDGYLAKFDGSGGIQWATYYGGTSLDYGQSVALDAAGNVYMAGDANSTTAIATPGSYQPAIAGGGDAYLVQFNSAGVRQWATYYGGTLTDHGNCITSDASGNIYMGGYTNSAGGIATPGAYQTVNGGGK